MRKVLLIVALTLSVGCGTFGHSVKQSSTLTVQAVETALAAAQDIERSTCNPPSFATNKLTPILECVPGSLITTQQHRTAAPVFERAFLAVAQTADAIKLLKPGDPAPRSLAEITSLMTQLQGVLPSAASTLIARIQDVIAKAQALAAAIAGR